MTLMPVILSDPCDDDLTPSEQLVYRTFLAHVEGHTTALRAVIRTARDTGVSRARVKDIIEKASPIERVLA
jgi:hypothetical protein